MPFTEMQLKKIEELYLAIESRKEHEYAAPTYKDSPCLKEMAEIILSQHGKDAETLEESIPALWYLTECYDKMGRPGMSAKFYTPQLENHVLLMKLKGYNDEDIEDLESCFYCAAKARNYYEPDDCADIINIVSGILPNDSINELLASAQESRRSSIKNDPVEKTEQYLAVIDEVEEKIDKEQTLDFCLEYWNLKAQFLFEHDIIWRSPAQLNPHVMFD